MSLQRKRIDFTRCVSKLIAYACDLGYEPMLDQCRRTRREARWNASHCRVQIDGERCERTPLDPYHATPGSGTHRFRPIGILKSTHRSGLAIDLYPISGGAISEDRAVYEKLATFWKALDTRACWGGDFESADLGHFSFEHNGRK